MTPELPIPPKFKFRNKQVQEKLEFVLYNLELRRAVAAWRQKWGKAAASPENWAVSDAAITAMLKLFTPTLSDNWHDIIYCYAYSDKVIPMADINQEFPDIENMNEQAALATTMAHALKTGTMMGSSVSALSIELKPDEVVIRVNRKLTSREWSQLSKSGSKLTRHLPHSVAHLASNIPLLSRIADLRRNKTKYSSIATKLAAENFGSFPEHTLRGWAVRAKKLGL